MIEVGLREKDIKEMTVASRGNIGGMFFRRWSGEMRVVAAGSGRVGSGGG